MVATKLRAIAWTQRRCFDGSQIHASNSLDLPRTCSSGGPGTRQISARVPVRPSPRTGSAYFGRAFLLAPTPHTRIAENGGCCSPPSRSSLLQASADFRQCRPNRPRLGIRRRPCQRARQRQRYPARGALEAQTLDRRYAICETPPTITCCA
jgi:hypothetical protein